MQVHPTAPALLTKEAGKYRYCTVFQTVHCKKNTSIPNDMVKMSINVFMNIVHFFSHKLFTIRSITIIFVSQGNALECTYNRVFL